mgnify:CR=1 FL=1
MDNRSHKFYFAFRSPYSWIAYKIMEDRYPHLLDQFELMPYWEPDPRTEELLAAMGATMPYTPMSKEKHLYILYDIKRIVKKMGCSIKWPVDLHPWWELPSLGFLLAKRYRKERAYMSAVHEARWTFGLDICKKETMEAIARKIGLDPDLLVSAPDDGSLREEGARMLKQACEDRVFGVPFFVVNKEHFWGIDRLPFLVERLENGAKKDAEAPKETDHVFSYTFDYDCPGGCG